MNMRQATKQDVPHIVQMLADDDLGAKREQYELPLPEFYLSAFEKIDSDPNNELFVIEEGSELIGTFQLTYIPYLTFKGGTRAQIEAVRIKKSHRGRGLGQQVFQWIIERAKTKDCHLLQLTTNKTRDRAYDFYEALGFESTHEGMKLYLKEW